MKLVQRVAFLLLLVSLAGGASPNLSSSVAEAQRPTPHPCQEPEGFDTPIDSWYASDSTEPRLLGESDLTNLVPYPTPAPENGISVEWALTGWDEGAANSYEVIYSGLWGLPRTGELTFDGGRGAIISVVAGEVILLVCGADGEIDTQYQDGQSTPLAQGSSTPIQAGTSFYVFLDQGAATYWLFGNRSGDPPESVVTIEIVGSNGGPRVCGLSTCWPAPVLPAKPIGANCDGDTCTVPGSPGGCGGIYCWTR